VAEVLRTTALVVALSLALFTVLEFGYRGQAALRQVVAGHDDPPLHPNAGEAWWRERPRQVDYAIRYDPYRGWWPRPFRSAVATVDSTGRRVVPQPPAPPDAPLVAFHGGSLMWGYVVRDSFTIPAQVARLLAARGLPIRAVNEAQTMFQLTQETATLLLALRDGRPPAIAVFLDGNNEVATAFQAGEPGHVLNEALLARRFADGNAGFWRHVALGFSQSHLIRRLATRPPRRSLPPDSLLCPDVARRYQRLARAVGALGRDHGFEVVFFWQPLLATSRKPPGPWERSLDPGPRWRPLLRACSRSADSLMTASGLRYVPLHAVFDGDATDVFVDDYGHMTERGHAVVAAHIAEQLAPLVRAARGEPPPAAARSGSR
jgi:hypothetical protein